MHKLTLLLVVISFIAPVNAGVKLEDMNWTQRGCNSSHTGSCQWTLGPTLNGSSPVILDGVIEGVATWGDQIIVNLQNNEIGSYTKNRQYLWTTTLKSKPIGVPAISGKIIFIQTAEGNLVKIDAYKGKILMDNKINADGATDVAISGNFAVFGGKNQVVCMNVKSNLRKWHFQTEDTPQPVSIYGSYVIINHQSKLSCLNLFTGKKVWELSTNAREIFTGTPVIGSGLVFISTLGNKLKAFSVFSGSEIWVKDTVSVTPVTFDNGKIYFPSTDGIYCCNAWNGEQIWKSNPGGTPALVWAQLAKAQNCLVIPCKDGKVYILNTDSGKQISTVQVSHQIAIEIAVGNDYLVVPDNSFKSTKGNGLWVFISTQR
ncbi:MAG: PQQ-like beta-propeller repeat protein [Caldisericia bacterium]|nr:PQQ-like beta-propeller repeat protein [Caldisericia bacterium]